MKFKLVIAIFAVSTSGLLSGCEIVGKVTGISFAAKGAYSELLSMKDELGNMQPSGELSSEETPRIKGKVVIVKKEGSGQAALDRFQWDGKFSDEPVDNRLRFYPPEVYAKTPEEIETLIKIECREHVGSDYYKASPNSDSQRQSYAKTICDVSIIDYKAKTLLAKVKKGNEFSPGVITIGGDGGDGYYKVMEEISAYLKGLPLELIPRVKPTPSGEVVPVAVIANQYQKSKESVSKYQDEEMTVTGWATFSKTYDSIILYGNEKQSGFNTITCKIDPSDMVDFAELEDIVRYKFTVVGKFDTRNQLMNLNQCRFIDAEKTISK